MRQRTYSQTQTQTPKTCYFCVHAIAEIDYKEAGLLKRFMSSYGKISPSRRNGCCAKHQRKLSRAIKHARFLAMLPFVIQ